MSGSLADSLDNTNVVSTHVKRHWNDLFVQFHADFFLGLSNTGNARFFALECSSNDFNDTTDFNSAGNSLWNEVRKNVLKRCFSWKNVLGVLERTLVEATASRGVTSSRAPNEFLNVMLSAGFYEHIATHCGWVKNRHDFSVKRSH